MNILFCLNSTFNKKNGGIASVSLSLVNGLRNVGHECFLISATKNAEVVDYNQFFLPNGDTSCDCKESFEWFKTFVVNNKIDIVINQNGTNPNENWPLYYGRRTNVKLITVYHSSLFEMWGWHTSNRALRRLIGILPLKACMNKLFNYIFRLKYYKKLSEQSSFSHRLVTLSELQFEGLLWFLKEKNNGKLLSIPNAIQHIPFDYNLLEQKKNIVLFVGRLSWEKNVDLLLLAWKMICQNHVDWELHIVGDGSERKKLELQCTSEKIDRVKFLGYKDPWSNYCESSIFCLTSEFEGFGLVLAEAMSFGTVPIASNSYINAEEIIDEGINGFLIEPFNIQLYSNKMEYLMSNKELRQQMALEAVAKSKNYQIESVISKWNELFIELQSE